MANKITLWDPFKELQKLEENLLAPLSGQATLFAPATDVYVEDDKQLIVEAHLPGLTEKDVEVSVHEGVLEIRAEKTEKEEKKGKRKYIRRESATSYFRRIALPENADEGKISAHFEDGMLKVAVPFKAMPKPKKIAIKAKKK